MFGRVCCCWCCCCCRRRYMMVIWNFVYTPNMRFRLKISGIVRCVQGLRDCGAMHALAIAVFLPFAVCEQLPWVSVFHQMVNRTKARHSIRPGYVCIMLYFLCLIQFDLVSFWLIKLSKTHDAICIICSINYNDYNQYQKFRSTQNSV